MPVSDIALVGRHNVANCLAAMALADAAGIDRAAQCSAMREYRGLPHRCQQVLEHDGVLWVNDSKPPTRQVRWQHWMACNWQAGFTYWWVAMARGRTFLP